MRMVPTLRRLRQECCLKFEATLGHKGLVSRKPQMKPGGDFWEAEAEEPEAFLADMEQVRPPYSSPAHPSELNS